jgi:hypothetical protein
VTALLLFQEDETVKQDQSVRTSEPPAPRPEPVVEKDTPTDRRDMKPEGEERTPEEAGYGYGV